MGTPISDDRFKAKILYYNRDINVHILRTQYLTVAIPVYIFINSKY